MSLDALLAAGRGAAAELMRETVRLFRPGEAVFDRNTGQTLEGPPEVVFYEGPARVRAPQTAEEQVQAGEQELALVQHRISLPFDAVLPDGERPQPGDVVEVLASPDPRMAGLRLWVTSIVYSSTATVWRITGEDRQ
jgi:hypothetical protein